jgi:putative ABC transport system substrate-binding protein
MLKNLFIIIIIIFGINSTTLANERILITVNQFVNHPALDAAADGVKKALKDRKFTPNKVEIKFDNAQGNMANAAQIAKHQAALHPAVMVAIATPSAQLTLKAKNLNSLLAFAAVTDPKAAGLIDNNTIGVNDQPPISDLLKIIKQTLPKAKTIGIIFNPGEINSVNMTEEMSKLALANGFKIEKSAVNSSSNIKLAIQQLIPNADVIYLPQDNLVVSSIDTIARITLRAKIPLIANDSTLVEKGLLFALGSDYFQDGVHLGNMIADHLSGIKVTPNIQSTGIKKLKFNDKVAAELNILIPQKELS